MIPQDGELFIGAALKLLSAFICLQVKGFRSYVDLYLKDKVDETGNALKVIHEEVNSRWEVCLTLSEKGFQQVSFVNSIATTKVTPGLTQIETALD